MSRPSWATRKAASVGSPEAHWRLCTFCGDYCTPKGSTIIGPQRLFCCALCKERIAPEGPNVPLLSIARKP